MCNYGKMLTGIVAGIAVCTSLATPSFAQDHDSHDSHAATTGTVSANAPGEVAAVSAKAPKLIDLEEAQDSLLIGDSGVNGLRSKVLFDNGGTTLIMLSFDKGGTKPRHTVPGIATLAVVSGDMSISVLDKPYEVKAGQLLVLQPNVLHNLTAKQDSVMLVTIHKTEGASTK